MTGVLLVACSKTFTAEERPDPEAPTLDASATPTDASMVGIDDAEIDGSSGGDASGFGDAGDSGNASDAGTMSDAGVTSLVQCAADVNPTAQGTAVSPEFYTGFRFQITSTISVKRVGATLSSYGNAGTVFAAMVRLSSATDVPDSPALTGADVLARAVLSLPAVAAGRTRVAAAMAITLTPGWYALAFGSGAFGGTSTGATATSFGIVPGCVSLPPATGAPFTIRQSDGLFILQSSSPNFFIEY